MDVKVPAVYYWKGNPGDATIVDISQGGIAMEIKQILVVGDIIRIQFNTSDHLIEFWGIVRNVAGNVIGVKFEEISNDAIEYIEEYVGVLLKSRGLATKEHYE